MANSLQNAGKVLNILESFYNQGKLGKAFFHLSTRKGFRSSKKGFVNHFPNLGKLLKILGKVSFQIFPKLPWERKGKGKLSVLPKNTIANKQQKETNINEPKKMNSPFTPLLAIEPVRTWHEITSILKMSPYAYDGL